MNNDFDFIKNKFDNDGITAPESISENAIAEKLSDKPRLKFYQRPALKKTVGIAACFAVLIGILPFVLSQVFQGNEPFAHEPPNMNITIDESDLAGLKTFSSYAEIKARVQRDLNSIRYYGEGGFLGYMGGDLAGMDTDSPVLYGSTYTQVANVDEADILKNNGKYIFYVKPYHEIFIYEGDKRVGKITGSDFDAAEYEYINSLYISGDKLVINTNNYSESVALTYIYDISDVSRPRQLHKFSQSGSYIDSRMIGSQLYIISGGYSYIYGCLEKGYVDDKDCYVYLGSDGKKSILPAEAIVDLDTKDNADMLIVSSINIDTAERSSQSKALFGCGTNVYCNEKNLYIAVSESEEKTKIVKISLEDSMKISAAATVSGYVHNQFSMDEKDGYFRIATTDENGNNLYILNSEMKETGRVTGIAKGEKIKAARYIDNMCYLITYVNTDPLFVIDISDPAKPAVKGSVEITGFSSMLHPIDKNTILGIGYDDNADIKLALFDISNAAKPEVLDSVVLKNTSSNAQRNHKAVVVNKEKDYIAFDCRGYDKEGEEFETMFGAVMLNVKNNKINILNKFDIKNKKDVYTIATRVTYIGDTLYVLDDEGEIYSFDV